jgi:uracil-DNA glycosylase family 4
MPVSGEGRRKIRLVGEAPGKNEDLEGKQFVGKTGKLLERYLRSHGINMRRDCWLTNTLICRPPNNATPTNLQIEYCRANLINSIEKLQPEIIVPIGDAAVESLMGWLWKGKTEAVGRWIGWKIPHQKLNAWICPIWHPSYIARQLDPDAKKRRLEVPIIWNQHLESISELSGRPWDEVPDYTKHIIQIADTRDAERWIHSILKTPNLSQCHAAFDFETNCLKPDWPESEIVSASICFEGKTAAFLWNDTIAETFKLFLRSPIRKIASNLKFEERWSLRLLRTHVRNWWHDTMQFAHIIDCRRDITSIKFQAFILLGQEPYNNAIEPLLKSRPGSKFNQVKKEVDVKSLLLYNGLDSLLEYVVAFNQRRILGYER